MSKFARILAAVLVAFAALPLTSALATQQSAAEFQRYVSEGKFAEGARALGAIASSDANDTEAQFGAGALQFLTAIKNLQGGLYHYGAGNELARQLNKWMRNVVPILRLPVPANPAPEVADYQVVRGILERFVDDLSLSAALLEKVGSRPVKLPFDPFKVAVDFNNDGRIAEQETMLGALMSIGRGSRVEKLPDATINFDTADVTWLQGYANALMGMGNLLLAFDFEESYENSFQMIFGNEATSFGRELKLIEPNIEKIRAIRLEIRALERRKRKIRISSKQLKKKSELRRKLRKLPKPDGEAATQAKREALKSKIAAFKLSDEQQAKKAALDEEIKAKEIKLAEFGAPRRGGFTEQIFDPLIFIHTINWKVVEPQRLAAVRNNYLEVMHLNRVTWKAAMAETDNDREWLPNAKQDGPFRGVRMTQKTIDSWLKVINEAEAVLNGEKLIAHLRFGKGINLFKFFEEAKHFDLVMFLSGPDAVRYFETGKEITNGRTWNALTRPFGRNFGLFMVWMN